MRLQRVCVGFGNCERGKKIWAFNFTLIWFVFAAHASLDEQVAHWFGLNQSKYQWALDDYYESSEKVAVCVCARGFHRCYYTLFCCHYWICVLLLQISCFQFVAWFPATTFSFLYVSCFWVMSLCWRWGMVFIARVVRGKSWNFYSCKEWEFTSCGRMRLDWVGLGKKVNNTYIWLIRVND